MTAATDTAPAQPPADPAAQVATVQPAAAPAVRPARPPMQLGAPLSFDDLYRLAQNLGHARLLPSALVGKPSDVLLIMMYGQEIGMAPIQSLQGIFVVNGRPSIAGQTWLWKLQQAGHSYTIDHQPGSCTVTITRGDNGQSHTETFSWEDAVRAGLAKKDTYTGYPKRMLMWRAVSDCATVIAPDVALGYGIAEVVAETASIQGVRGAVAIPEGPLAAAFAGVEDVAPVPAAPAQGQGPAPAAQPAEEKVVEGEIVTPEARADLAARYAAMNQQAGAPQPERAAPAREAAPADPLPPEPPADSVEFTGADDGDRTDPRDVAAGEAADAEAKDQPGPPSRRKKDEYASSEPISPEKAAAIQAAFFGDGIPLPEEPGR